MKLQINDVVYNKKYNTIGIVLDIFDRGDVRTDSDGIVYQSDLKLIKSRDCFNRFISIINPSIAPSTMKFINENNLI